MRRKQRDGMQLLILENSCAMSCWNADDKVKGL